MTRLILASRSAARIEMLGEDNGRREVFRQGAEQHRQRVNAAGGLLPPEMYNPIERVMRSTMSSSRDAGTSPFWTAVFSGAS